MASADPYPRRDLAVLLLVALVSFALAAWLVPSAPYTDAAYYTLVAERLATGHGFSVPVLYSFLEVGGALPADPSLPVASNGHWMPLTSVVAAASMSVFGVDWRAGQVPMVLCAVALVGITHAVTWELWRDRRLALVAAALMVVPGQLLVMLPLVDGSAVFGLLGALALWAAVRAVESPRWGWWLVGCGVLIGLATLARIDGAFLAVAPLVVWLRRRREVSGPAALAIGVASAVACLLVLAPWFARNLEVFGAVLPSTGGHTLWITSYNEQFTIGREVSLSTYLAWGVGPILGSKLSAAVELLGRTVAITGGVFALFFLAGSWVHRRRPEIQPFLAYWLVMFAAMALLFTFHAAHGAFVHSAPAWLPMAFAIAVGSVAPVSTAAGRWWPFLRRAATHRFLLVASLAGAVLLSALSSAVLMGQWRSAADRLAPAASYLSSSVPADEVVMFADPARLNLLTGHPGVAAPFDPFDVIAEVVRAYDVRWVVVTLDGGETRDALGLWDGAAAIDAEGESPSFLPAEPAFEAPGVRVYEVRESGG
jgi:4-amino-4-deoxy-L-arabinose transferase-like glycosyltransferase